MNLSLHVSQAVLDLIFGVVILIQPKFLAWIIGIWLIITGLIGLGIIKI